jgi:2,3,4,5-tetrahydropyridine-2-carboxylate N-succinyltransferase
MDPRLSIIEAAFEDRANINPANASAAVLVTPSNGKRING